MVTLRFLDRDGSRYTVSVPVTQVARSVANIEAAGGMVL